MKKHIVTCSALVLAFVVAFIAAFGNKTRYCSLCGELLNFPLISWGLFPTHYHLKGDNWNKFHESPQSYFEQKTVINENGEEVLVEGGFIFCGYGGDIKIPKTINGETVNSVSFENRCWNVTGVYFPDSVTLIPENCFVTPTYDTAFDGLYIEKVYIPSSVTEIGGHAFIGTKWLDDKRTENPLVIVNNILVDGQTSSDAVEIPDSTISISDYAFENAADLTSITIPDSITKISNGVFLNCKELLSINFGNSITEIGKEAFNGCTKLHITIPDSVTEIGAGAFANCTSLENITLPKGLTSIENDLFNGCKKLKSIAIPDGVTKIGASAFANCESITRIIIPDSVTDIAMIDSSAFKGCPNLKYIEFPASVSEENFENYITINLISSNLFDNDKTRIIAHRGHMYRLGDTAGVIDRII